ncbi:MAG: RodZ domain-containing protein [Chloroflexota bacterium]
MSKIVGQQLRRCREERKLTLEQAASATRIRVHYLQALEAGDFGALPSAVQARGFLRAYAGYLGLNGDSLLDELDGRKLVEPAAAASPAELEPEPEEAEEALEEADEDEPPGSVDLPAAPAASAGPDTRPLRAPAGSAAAASPTPEAAAPAPKKRTRSAAIFKEVGQTLQRQRDLLGISLEDVERHTHLRQRYLQALEAGDLDNLPSPVQGRGMLNNYAIFLGLNPEPLLLRFAEGLQARLAARQPRAETASERRKRKSPGLPPALRRFFAGDLLIGALLAVFLLIFVGWLTVRIFSLSGQAGVTATAPSIADVLLASPTPTLTPTAAAQTPTPPPAAPTTAPEQPEPQPAGEQTGAPSSAETPAAPAPGGAQTPGAAAGVQVSIAVRQRGYLRVLVDGKVQFDGRVIPGSAYNYAGAETVEIQAGNAAGLQIFYNGIDQGPGGAFGQVIQRIYTAQGMLTPTPLPSPTPKEGAGTPPAEASATPSAAP